MVSPSLLAGDRIALPVLCAPTVIFWPVGRLLLKNPLLLLLLVNIEAFSLFNKTRTQKLSFNDTVAIQLVAKSNTLLGFGKKSFSPP